MKYLEESNAISLRNNESGISIISLVITIIVIIIIAAISILGGENVADSATKAGFLNEISEV